MEEKVTYSYNYFNEAKETDKRLFDPKILLKLPKIRLTLPKINLCQNFEPAFC